MAKSVLITWIGGNDLQAVGGVNDGPILSTLKAENFTRLEVLNAYPAEKVLPYMEWLGQQTSITRFVHHENLSSPINFSEIYLAAEEVLSRVYGSGNKISILLSPGTPVMQSVWILLGKTRYPVTFYQSTLEQGVQKVHIPFEIAAEYVPSANSLGSRKLAQLANPDVPVDAAFNNIITQNETVKSLKVKAQILSDRKLPVLICGETGTGKELFARAIHNAGPRASQSFMAINCGAIPADLVDSVLFGHKKGAFTGAVTDRHGVFQQAHGGTLFLDEFGELTPDVQVRLLRVLQEGVVTPVGASQEQQVDVRIIAATHRDLMAAVANGEFREDLFYRVAVGVLKLPPLRDREGDISLITDVLLAGIAEREPGIRGKIISASAKNIILKHAWRGNIRELQATLLRAALWSAGDTIQAEDIEQALFSPSDKQSETMLVDVSQGIDIQNVIGSMVKASIGDALKITNNNKTKAAELLGLKNYQTLNNWIKKYSVK